MSQHWLVASPSKLYLSLIHSFWFSLYSLSLSILGFITLSLYLSMWSTLFGFTLSLSLSSLFLLLSLSLAFFYSFKLSCFLWWYLFLSFICYHLTYYLSLSLHLYTFTLFVYVYPFCLYISIIRTTKSFRSSLLNAH